VQEELLDDDVRTVQKGQADQEDKSSGARVQSGRLEIQKDNSVDPIALRRRASQRVDREPNWTRRRET